MIDQETSCPSTCQVRRTSGRRRPLVSSVGRRNQPWLPSRLGSSNANQLVGAGVTHKLRAYPDSVEAVEIDNPARGVIHDGNTVLYDPLDRADPSSPHPWDRVGPGNRSERVMRTKPIHALLYVHSGTTDWPVVTVVRTMLSCRLEVAFGGHRRESRWPRKGLGPR